MFHSKPGRELTRRAEIPYREANPILRTSAMAIRPILVLPDARLRAVADPIVEIDDEIRTLAQDMLDTM
ncbi:peptide deformylase, partial [Devosia sp.]|uniref:peptide deformylase n=1 Tax=Devosia sp. TaxID=1871048 RepID=UPI002AFDFA5D